MMTPDQLSKLERLHREATPPPWRVDPDDYTIWAQRGELGARCVGGNPSCWENRRDIDLICAMHAALPDLLATIREQGERIRELERVLTQVEWAGNSMGPESTAECPLCEAGAPPFNDEHEPGCVIAVALNKGRADR